MRKLFAVITLAALPLFAQAQVQRTIVVDPIDDLQAANGCTLREAIHLANAGALAGLGCTAAVSGSGSQIAYLIQLPAYTYTLTGAAGENDNLGGDLDVLAPNVTLSGAGMGATILEGGDVDRILHLVFPTVNLSLSGVALRNGRVTGIGGGADSDDGGAILNNQATLTVTNALFESSEANGSPDSYGGAIHNSGRLTVIGSRFVGNSAAAGGGAISTFACPVVGSDALSMVDSELRGNSAGFGGGIHVGSVGCTTNVLRSAFVENFARLEGGAIRAAGQFNLANSSLLGNASNGNGGGVSNVGGSRLNFVTIAGNIADADNMGGGNGGGVYRQAGTLHLQNSVVASNMDLSGGGPDCFGEVASGQFNAVRINQGCEPSFPGGSPNANSDFAGTLALPLEPELPASDGLSLALVPAPTSLLVDKIEAARCTYSSQGTNPLYADGETALTDQRSSRRIAPCDIGAVEVSETIFADGFETITP
jgi:hypothetical protein